MTTRGLIIASPLVLAAGLAVYFWLGDNEEPSGDPAPAVARADAAHESPYSLTGDSQGRDQSFAAWFHGQNDREHRATPDAAPATAPSHAGSEAGTTMLESIPEPLYMGTGPASDEQLADASQKATRGGKPEERVAGLAQLAAMGDARVLNILTEALADPDVRVRQSAVAAARRLADRRGDPDGEIRRWLTQAGYSGDAQVSELARAGANDLAENAGEEPPFARN